MCVVECVVGMLCMYMYTCEWEKVSHSSIHLYVFGRHRLLNCYTCYILPWPIMKLLCVRFLGCGASVMDKHVLRCIKRSRWNVRCRLPSYGAVQVKLPV